MKPCSASPGSERQLQHLNRSNAYVIYPVWKFVADRSFRP